MGVQVYPMVKGTHNWKNVWTYLAKNKSYQAFHSYIMGVFARVAWDLGCAPGLQHLVFASLARLGAWLMWCKSPSLSHGYVPLSHGSGETPFYLVSQQPSSCDALVAHWSIPGGMKSSPESPLCWGVGGRDRHHCVEVQEAATTTAASRWARAGEVVTATAASRWEHTVREAATAPWRRADCMSRRTTMAMGLRAWWRPWP
jgi:hypothetical protein